MKRKTVSRILAILGLVCAVAMAVCMTVYFFNMDNKAVSGPLGTLSVIFVCATLIFFIPAYALNKRCNVSVVDENGVPVNGADENDVESDDDAPMPDVSVFSESQTENGEQEIEPDDDVIPDGKSEGNDKRKQR